MYPLAQHSLADVIASRRIEGQLLLEALVQVGDWFRRFLQTCMTCWPNITADILFQRRALLDGFAAIIWVGWPLTSSCYVLDCM